MRLVASLLDSRATLVAASALLLAACGGGAISPEKALTMPVVEVAGGSVKGEALARWLVAQKDAPTKAEANSIISAWINDALLVDAFRRNVALDEPATFDSVVMETAARTVVGQYFQKRDAGLPAVTERQIDSTLDIDQARVFQQIVIHFKGKADSASVAAFKTRVKGIHDKLKAGADFTAAVREYSDDSISKANGGYLPALSAAEMGERLSSLYNLAPNELSQIVQSPVSPAFIILRRATRKESRNGVKAWLAPRLARHADSLFVDSIARTKEMVIAADARLRVRAMAKEPVDLVDGPPLVTWKGGALTPAATRNGILSLAPIDRYSLTDAPDTVVTQFLTGLFRREILLPVAVTEPLPTAAIRSTYLTPYRRVLDSLKAVVSRFAGTLPPADAATAHIDSMMAKRSPFLPLPGALANVLRARSPVKVDHAVLEAVVRGALPRWQELHKPDSTAKKSAGDSTGGAASAIKPAAGGAPKPP